jgi:hypothetical protein
MGEMIWQYQYSLSSAAFCDLVSGTVHPILGSIIHPLWTVIPMIPTLVLDAVQGVSRREWGEEMPMPAG